jgi:hypothetical protein
MRIRTAVVLFLSVLPCACAYTPTTSLAYQPIPVEAKPRLQPRLIVKPLSEARPPRRYPSMLGMGFMTYIPLVPYVRSTFERLDESSLLHEEARKQSGKPLDRQTQHFTEAIASVIADDLRSSGLFSEVRLLADPTDPLEGAHALEGDLRSTEFGVNATSYMLGMAGVLLWLLPIPVGWDTADVLADLRLIDPSGTVIWRGTLSGRGRQIFTLYNSSGAPVSSRMRLEITRYGSNDEGIDGDSLWAYHASAIRSGMEPIKQSLAAFLNAAPRNP